METYDAIVIGAGQAGTPLAKKLAQAGKKIALVEKRLVGGTCINDGCTPTKTMVASAKAAYIAAKCNDLGVHINDYSIDMPQIKKRKDGVVDRFRGGSEKGLETTDNLDLIFGEATFTGHKTLSIQLKDGGMQQVQADQIFINTGLKTSIPDIPGLAAIDYLTSTTILELETVPDHLLIVGAGYIGMEFGQMFRRFGSKVTILERSPRALPREDDDIAQEVVKILEDEGIVFYVDAKVAGIKNSHDGAIEVEISSSDNKNTINCSHILIACGRKPQTESLQLAKGGIATDDNGFIKVNDKLETTVPGIYALGDVKGGPAFTHIAYNDYTIVYRNLIKHDDLSMKNRMVPYCMFIDPPLARVGLSETEAQKKGLNIKVAKLPMRHVARAIEVGETLGFMKAVIDADTKKILGVAVLGEEGGEIMSVLQMAMVGGITYEKIRYMVFAHPTYSESLNNLFMSLDA